MQTQPNQPWARRRRIPRLLAGVLASCLALTAPFAGAEESSAGPIVEREWRSLYVPPGRTVTLAAAAQGSQPFDYQWYKDGQPLDSARTATLELPGVSAADAGDYAVRISNDAGSVLSGRARLIVDQPQPPRLTLAPAPTFAAAGQAATLWAVADGFGPLRYQWRRDGVDLPGATSAQLTLPAASAAHAGAYTVAISNEAGTIVSAPARLTVVPAVPGHLRGIASRCFVGTGGQIAISGIVVDGDAPKTLIIRLLGPGLRAFGINDAIARPELTVFSGSTPIAHNAGWKQQDAALVRQTTAAIGLSPLLEDGADCALVASLPPGAYTVQLRDSGDASGVGLVEIYDVHPAVGQPLRGIATRAHVDAGSRILIAGLVVGGSTAKRVQLRALGPGLTVFGVGGVMVHPRLSVFAGSDAIGANVDWRANPDASLIAAAAVAIGLHPLAESSADSALLIDLAPGAYTVQVADAGDLPGIALLEAYGTR